jgi:hypothetical protein
VFLTCKAAKETIVSKRMKTAVAELQASQSLLLSGELDPRVLSEFRDVLNRVRNVAWAAHQSVAGKANGEDPASVGTLLATERVRTAYQLCCLIQQDLGKEDIEFQKGQLSELHTVTKKLEKALKERL